MEQRVPKLRVLHELLRRMPGHALNAIAHEHNTPWGWVGCHLYGVHNLVDMLNDGPVSLFALAKSAFCLLAPGHVAHDGDNQRLSIARHGAQAHLNRELTSVFMQRAQVTACTHRSEEHTSEL